MNHDDYPEDYLRGILREVRSIALVGASPKVERPSNYVFKALLDEGYEMFPVNPGQAEREIHGQICHFSLLSLYKSLGRHIDMVDIFRSSDAALSVTKEAIEIGAKVVWMQLDVRNDAAAKLAEDAGLKVVMNRCPLIEMSRSTWTGRLN
ncbi:CoA-binding protein [Kiloniella antarctica]|uniref:CoA-binding protein n=1 Tax=Kiloniella antarctica TaxID=1550907 RepID=A0ABW5BFZ7_9PROT